MARWRLILLITTKETYLLILTIELAKEAYEAAKLSACLIEKEHSMLTRNPPGGSSLLPIWYAYPPFRVHHQTNRTIELEWYIECDNGSSKLLKLTITYLTDGRYLIEVTFTYNIRKCISYFRIQSKATYVRHHYFRVEADGVSKDVNLAVYSKGCIRHIHIWQAYHHYFREKLGLELSEDEESQHKPKFEAAVHRWGTVLAPMAGLVVNVMVKNKTKVEEGQSVLVLEARKMEHVVKTPLSGYVQLLQVTAGEQVSGGSVPFSVQDE